MYYVLRNRMNGKYWTGQGSEFEKQSWGQIEVAKKFESDDDAKKEMKQRNLYCFMEMVDKSNKLMEAVTGEE